MISYYNLNIRAIEGKIIANELEPLANHFIDVFSVALISSYFRSVLSSASMLVLLHMTACKLTLFTLNPSQVCTNLYSNINYHSCLSVSIICLNNGWILINISNIFIHRYGKGKKILSSNSREILSLALFVTFMTLRCIF